MSSGFLERMAAGSRARAQAARASVPLDELQRRARAAAPVPALRRDPRGFDLIAEVKLQSPSAGPLAGAGADPAAQAVCYARGGAAAVSVLTEPLEFGGHLDHLRQAARALAPLGVPVMRKDFLLDAYQVWEARAAGAGGVLVMLALLDDAGVLELVRAAADAGVFVLLEAFDEAELQRAQRLRPQLPDAPLLLGLNSRDLRTLAVDRERFAQLRAAFPAGLPAVAESGLESVADVGWVAGLGYELALVGSALMTSPSPQQRLADMLAAGRGAR